jgi:hypothetical protein
MKTSVASVTGSPTQIGSKSESLAPETLRIEPVDHQIGAGPDQGAGAADDTGVGERDQQARQLQAVSLGPVLHGRDKDGHDRRVVEECAQTGDRQHQPQTRIGRSARAPEQTGADPADGTGLGESRHDHVEHADGQHAGIGETAQGLVGCQDAEQEQQCERTRGDHIGRRAAEGEETEAEHHDAQAEPAFPTEPTALISRSNQCAEPAGDAADRAAGTPRPTPDSPPLREGRGQIRVGVVASEHADHTAADLPWTLAGDLPVEQMSRFSRGERCQKRSRYSTPRAENRPQSP